MEILGRRWRTKVSPIRDVPCVGTTAVVVVMNALRRVFALTPRLVFSLSFVFQSRSDGCRPLARQYLGPLIQAPSGPARKATSALKRAS